MAVCGQIGASCALCAASVVANLEPGVLSAPDMHVLVLPCILYIVYIMLIVLYTPTMPTRRASRDLINSICQTTYIEALHANVGPPVLYTYTCICLIPYNELSTNPVIHRYTMPESWSQNINKRPQDGEWWHTVLYTLSCTIVS